jgi:hypothetical protein
VAQEDVQLFPRLSIRRRPVPKVDSPAECPACAVTRWLRVLAAAHAGLQNDVRDLVRPTADADDLHDCLVGLGGRWRSATVMLPSIDRRGWLALTPLSARAISSVVKARLAVGELARAAYVAPAATMSKLTDGFDDVDERAAAMMLRLQAIVDDGADLLDHMRALSEPRPTQPNSEI